MQRQLKLTVTRILLQEAFTCPEHLLPTLAVLSFLPMLLAFQISAASDTSQQQQQQHELWLPPAAPATQDLSASHGKHDTDTNSLSNQLPANMGERGAIHCIFSLFFTLVSASSMRNITDSHTDSPLTLQSWAVSSQISFRSEEGDREPIAELCWQRVCVSVCVQGQGRAQPRSCLVPDGSRLHSHLSAIALWLNSQFL